MSHAQVLFFGRLRELMGSQTMTVDQAFIGRPVSELRLALARLNDDSQGVLLHSTVRVAINKTLLPPGADPLVCAGDEIAFMPPRSGG